MKKLTALFLAAILLLCSGCASGMISSLPKVPGKTEAPTVAETKASETAALTEAPTDAPATSAPATETEAVPTETETEPVPTETEAPTEPTEPYIDPWSLLGELSFDAGSYTDKYGYDWSYSYDIPCLNAYTADARRINADIDAVFGEQVRESLANIEEGESIGILDIGFHGEVWEDILTIVVVMHTDWSFDDYRVYCYDCSEGRWLDTRALLERLEIDENDFLEGCRELFIDVYKEQYSEIPEDRRTEYGYYDGLARVDDERYVNLDLMVYPDGDGDLVVIAPIVSLAGADFYYQQVWLYLDGGNG